MNPLIAAIGIPVALVIGVVVGVVVGMVIRKRVAEAEIGSAEEEAAKLVDEGRKQAETQIGRAHV